MSKSIPRIKNVTITIVENGEEKDKTITVKKAGLGKWKQLSDTIERLIKIVPKYLEDQGIENPDKFIENMQPIDLLEMVPNLFQYATEEITKLLQLGTGLDPDFIDEHITIDEAYELFKTIAEVSGLFKMSKNLPILQVLARRAWRENSNISPLRKKPTKSSTKSSGE